MAAKSKSSSKSSTVRNSSPALKKSAPKTKTKAKTHPPYASMVEKGLSRQKIAVYLDDVWGMDRTDGRVKAHTKRALETAVEDGRMMQTAQTFWMNAAQRREVRSESPEEPAPKKKAAAPKAAPKKKTTAKTAPKKTPAKAKR
ncbi:hypothetical protein RQP46_010024 [Phenoliferia psychrophenolica]